MENMDKGFTEPKRVLIVQPKIPQMLQNLSAQFVCPSPKVLDFNEKRLHWAFVVHVSDHQAGQVLYLRLKRPQLPSKYMTEKTLDIWLNMYSDWIKGFYGFILSLPFVLLFICCTSIVCRYKSKVIEDSKIVNLKKDRSFSINFV